MLLRDVTFNNNMAINATSIDKSGHGGGLYYSCGAQLKCYVLFRGSNRYTNNRAENSGGAVQWDDLEPY